MLLEELEWHGVGLTPYTIYWAEFVYCNKNIFVAKRDDFNTYFIRCNGKKYKNMDPLTAQAVLFELTEGKT